MVHLIVCEQLSDYEGLWLIRGKTILEGSPSQLCIHWKQNHPFFFGSFMPFFCKDFFFFLQVSYNFSSLVVAAIKIGNKLRKFLGKSWINLRHYSWNHLGCGGWQKWEKQIVSWVDTGPLWLVQHREPRVVSRGVCPAFCHSRNIFLYQNSSGAAKPFAMKFTPSSETDHEFLWKSEFCLFCQIFVVYESCLCKHSVQEVMYTKVNDIIHGRLISTKKYCRLLWIFV